MFIFKAKHHLVFGVFVGLVLELNNAHVFLTSNTSPLYFVVSSQENPDGFAYLRCFAVHNKTLKTNLK